jgi:hypothetical protein
VTERWLLPTLYDRCASERLALAARSANRATEAELFRPGREQNRDRSAYGWAVYFAALRFSIAQLDAELKPAETEGRDAAALLFGILTDVPLIVDNLYRVYPKSISALAFVGECQERLLQINKERAQSVDENRLDLVAELDSERSSLTELIGWCATYSEPSLPFTDTAALPPLPLYVKALGQARLSRICTALDALHEQRLAFLRSITPIEAPPMSGADAQLGSAWYSQMVEQLSEQLERPSETLTRDWSLPSLFALAVVAAEMHVSPPDRGAALVA